MLQHLETADRVKAFVRVGKVVDAGGDEANARVLRGCELDCRRIEVEPGELRFGQTSPEQVGDEALTAASIEERVWLEVGNAVGDGSMEALNQAALDRIAAGVLPVIACVDAGPYLGVPALPGRQLSCGARVSHKLPHGGAP